jgi:predicted SAM-dependent methyltransferase
MLRKIIKKARSIFYSGSIFFCPICEKGARKFLTHAARPLARCPHCGSFERHRLLWIALQKKWNQHPIGISDRLLHVSPEKVFTKILQPLYDYISIDLDEQKAMYSMDITNLEFTANEFEAIICIHVLEHIPEDRKAMSELFRVLKPGGWGTINVPMSGNKTLEDPTIKDPKDRLRMFGQEDHVRFYGEDFIDRLKEAGFLVTVIKKEEIVTPEEDMKYSLAIENEVIFVTKS